MLICYTDGACKVSNPGICASSFIVYRPGLTFAHDTQECVEVHRHSRVLEGLNTNIVAEYNALLDALRWARDNKESLDIRCDLQLVVKQVHCEWAVKHASLAPFVSEAFGLLSDTRSKLSWVKGHNGDPGNEAVDILCNETLFKRMRKVPDTNKKSKGN